MKRLIIDGDWKDSGGTWTLLTMAGWLAAEVNPERCTVTVEDVADPLPTTPGETFWGRIDDDAVRAQRFLVQKSPTRPGCITYAATDGFHIADVEVERMGLVRLPDPDAKP